MNASIKSLKGKVKRPVRVAKICLDGDLWARHDELTEQLAAMGSQSATKLAGDPKLQKLAAEIGAVEKAMRDSEVAIRFRGISAFQLKELQRRFPVEGNPDSWDIDAGFAALIAASAEDPTTEEEAQEFLNELHKAAADKLFNTVWAATGGSAEVPTNARASALIQASASK